MTATIFGYKGWKLTKSLNKKLIHIEISGKSKAQV